MYYLNPKNSRKYIDKISLQWILNTNKEEIENSFQKIFYQQYMYFINSTCILSIVHVFLYRKEILYCDDFNTSFSTFVRTLFIVSKLFPLFHFLVDLQVESKYPIKYQILARCLRNYSRQKLFPNNFFGIVNINYFFNKSLKFLFFLENL